MKVDMGLNQFEYDTLLLDILMMEKKERCSSEGSDEEEQIYMYGTDDMRDHLDYMREIIDTLEIIIPKQEGNETEIIIPKKEEK